jgi:hypothetical protein
MQSENSPLSGLLFSCEFLWSDEAAGFTVYAASRLRREVAFWFVALMMDESSFFFLQQANDLRRQRHQLLRVLLDGCLALAIFAFSPPRRLSNI